MRTITLSGQDFIVNPLKGKDIKALKAQGFDLMGGGYSISEGMDAVFATAGFDAATTDELPFPDILALHKAIVNETFGVAEEEKNSRRSGSGFPVRVRNTAPPAGRPPGTATIWIAKSARGVARISCRRTPRHGNCSRRVLPNSACPAWAARWGSITTRWRWWRKLSASI